MPDENPKQNKPDFRTGQGQQGQQQGMQQGQMGQQTQQRQGNPGQPQNVNDRNRSSSTSTPPGKSAQGIGDDEDIDESSRKESSGGTRLPGSADQKKSSREAGSQEKSDQGSCGCEGETKD